MSRHTAKGTRFEALISKADIALENEFYLEAISICYAIIEERLRSVLIKTYGRKLGEKHKVDSCLKRIKRENKTNSILSKYFTHTLLTKVDQWKDDRNEIMHQLAEKGIEFSKIVTCAETGRELLAELAATTMRWKKEWKKQNK